jgi:RNA polymerase sigma-70 factor (ECF subfamily)
MDLALSPTWLMALPLRSAPRLRPAVSDGDAELVERIRGGDRRAEEQLYRKYAPQLLGLATRLLGRRVEAEDAVQDTFVIAFERMQSLRDGAAVRGWLTQIAVSQVHRRFRRRKLLRVIGLENGADDATLERLASAEATGEMRAELGALDRVLSSLPADQRIAWMMRHVEGEELEAIAGACGCSLATIKRRIAAADARVAEHVKRGEEAP